jgi:hypothetical protein
MAGLGRPKPDTRALRRQHGTFQGRYAVDFGSRPTVLGEAVFIPPNAHTMHRKMLFSIIIFAVMHQPGRCHFTREEA